MANNAKTAAPAEPTAQPTAVAMMTPQSEQAITFAKNQLDVASTKSREAMQVGLKAFDAVTTMSRGNVDALLQSSRVASGAFNAIAKEFADYSKQSVERAASAAQSLTSAKTVPELMQMQSEFARVEFATAIAEATRLSQAMVATMTAIVEPLQQQVKAAAQIEVPSKDA